jgi:hypothetical protein
MLLPGPRGLDSIPLPISRVCSEGSFLNRLTPLVMSSMAAIELHHQESGKD